MQRTGLALSDITPASFALPGLGTRLSALLEDQLLDGPGFAVLRGLPVERYTIEQSAIAYLGLGSNTLALARPSRTAARLGRRAP